MEVEVDFSISDNSKVELKSCLELLSVLNFIGNSIVAVNNSKQTDLDLCSDKSFRIQVKFPWYKVQWIIFCWCIFFSVKRQQLGSWSIQWQLHWMSSLTQPCLVQDSSILTKDKGLADLDLICVWETGPNNYQTPWTSRLAVLSIWLLGAEMVVTNKSCSRPLSGDFGKPAALDTWKHM